MASSSSISRSEKGTEITDFRIEQLMEQSQYTEAAEVGQQLLEKSRSAPEPEHPHTSSTTYSFGTALHQLLASREKTLGLYHPNTIAVLDAISESLCRLRKYKDSMEILDEELRRCERVFGSEHELTIKSLRHMGQVYMMQGDSHLASSVLLRALELSQRLYGLEHSTTSRIHDDLSKVRGTQGTLALKQALSARYGLPIPGDPFAGMISVNLSQLLSRYKSVTGITSGGPEVLNALAMRLSDQLGQPRQPPLNMPSAFEDDVESTEDESNEDESTEDKSNEDESTGLPTSPSLARKARNLASSLTVTHTNSSAATESSQLFRSLVERSIESWKLLSKRKGMTRAIKQHSQILRRLDSLDDFLSHGDHQYWFFQLRKAFMRQEAFQKWDPACLDDYILLPMENTFANETHCMFVSHYWRAHGNPDPQGLDLRPLQEQLRQGIWPQVAYFWVDFTCLPQWERTAPQEKYFRRALLSIPKLVRDCCFTWHFPDFQPRLWVLFEAAEFVRNRSRPIPLADIKPFMNHLREMKGYGVRYVLNRHGYRCTNQSDRELVIGWLELLLILSRIVPSIRTRQAILNAVDNAMVRTCHHEESGITVDKENGTVTMNGRSYKFSPVRFEATKNSDADVRINSDSYYEDEVRKALHRVKRAPDNRASEEIGREYDREGEYKIGEVLHRMALADKDSTFISDVLVGLSFLAENLENQGLYEEAETLRRREVLIAEENNGTSSDSTLESREKLATVVQKRKLDTYYQRWKLEPLENILELERPKILETGQSDAVVSGRPERQTQTLEDRENLNELKKVLWALLEHRKETLGPYHADTLATMCNLARVLRRESNLAAAAKLFWLAFAISDDRWGPEHVKTLAIMSELAVCMGPDERKEMYRQQLERHLQAVDFDHPDTYTVKHNLHEMLDQNETIQVVSGKVQIRRQRWV